MANSARKFFHEEQLGLPLPEVEMSLPVDSFLKPKRRYRRKGKKPALTEQQLNMILWDAEWELPNQYAWTDQEILALREGVLIDRLRTLLDLRNGLATRREAWEWLNSDDVEPFSFRICVEACSDLVDYVEVRDQLIDLVTRKGGIPVAAH